MAKKNKPMIAIYKTYETLRHYCRELIPNLYAAFCLVLYERGMDADTIEEIVLATQTKWQENVGQEGDMIRRCEELTGIEVRGESYES